MTTRNHASALPVRTGPGRAERLAMLVACTVPFLSGCGATVRSAAAEAPRIATPIVIDESLKSLEDEPTRARIAQVMGTPEMQRAVRELAASAVAGTAEEVKRSLTPELEREISAQATQAAAQAGRAAIRGLSAEIPATLGPALRESVVQTLRAPDMREALQETASDVARGTLVGTRDVLLDIHQQTEQTGPLQKLVNLIRYSWVIAGLFGALVAALAAWTALLHAKSREADRERARQTASAEAMTEALVATRGKPWSNDLLAFLKERFDDDERAPALRGALRRAGAALGAPGQRPAQ